MSVLPIDPFLQQWCAAAATDDERFMCRAVLLAERGVGWVNPNPLVGCVIVREGEVLAGGYHAEYGGPHAEVAALEDALSRGVSIEGATMYVTLEPCAHEGKTPACAPMVAASGVARVVVACVDPFEKVNGAGVQMLKEVGMTVDVGVGEKLAQYQNRAFFHWVRTGRPFVSVKVAISADNMVTAKRGTTTQVSGELSVTYAHSLRQRFDAIMVGAGTVEVDDPRLTVRYGDRPRNPMPVIIDGTLRSSPTARVFEAEQVVVCVGDRVPKERRRLYPRHVVFMEFAAKNDYIDLAEVFAALGKQGVQSVLVEGGPSILTQLLEQELAHEWVLVRSPQTFNNGVPFVQDVQLYKERMRLVSTITTSSVDSIEYYRCL